MQKHQHHQHQQLHALATRPCGRRGCRLSRTVGAGLVGRAVAVGWWRRLLPAYPYGSACFNSDSDSMRKA
eukprot:361720-Chlamydomonas_euryale.AAC.2